jgi:hypothetical protein
MKWGIKGGKQGRELKDIWINNAKNELYQLINFYIVFQGIVFTIVAQGNTLNCNNF